MKRLIVICAIPAIIGGCTTRMQVKKAANDTAGFQYYLPQPLIVVKPAKDGTLDVSVEMVPDKSKAYSISSRSFVAKHKMTVQVDDKGLLKKVSFSGDATELAKAQIETAANLTKAQMEATAAAAKEAATQEAAAKKARDEKIATATAARDKAKLEFDQAEAVLEAIEGTSEASEDALTKARADVARTRIAFIAAEEALTRVLAEGNSNNSLSSSSNVPVSGTPTPGGQGELGPIPAPTDDDPVAAQPAQPVPAQPATSTTNQGREDSAKSDRVWGPVIYRVINKEDQVCLDEVRFESAGQASFRTSSKIEEKKEPATAPLALRHTKSKVIDKLTFTVRSNLPIETIAGDAEIFLGNDTRNVLQRPHVTLTWTHEVIVTLTSKLPKGTYRLEIPLVPGGKKDTVRSPVEFVVPR